MIKNKYQINKRSSCWTDGDLSAPGRASETKYSKADAALAQKEEERATAVQADGGLGWADGDLSAPGRASETKYSKVDKVLLEKIFENLYIQEESTNTFLIDDAFIRNVGKLFLSGQRLLINHAESKLAVFRIDDYL